MGCGRGDGADGVDVRCNGSCAWGRSVGSSKADKRGLTKDPTGRDMNLSLRKAQTKDGPLKLLGFIRRHAERPAGRVHKSPDGRGIRTMSRFCSGFLDPLRPCPEPLKRRCHVEVSAPLSNGPPEEGGFGP